MDWNWVRKCGREAVIETDNRCTRGEGDGCNIGRWVYRRFRKTLRKIDDNGRGARWSKRIVYTVLDCQYLVAFRREQSYLSEIVPLEPTLTRTSSILGETTVEKYTEWLRRRAPSGLAFNHNRR